MIACDRCKKTIKQEPGYEHLEAASLYYQIAPALGVCRVCHAVYRDGERKIRDEHMELCVKAVNRWQAEFSKNYLPGERD